MPPCRPVILRSLPPSRSRRLSRKRWSIRSSSPHRISSTGFAKNALIWTKRAATFADALLRRREAALERLRGLLPGDLEIDLIRHHGDLHLGQILIVKDDACIIDFEGEPNRSANERRRKAPSARDVAGFVRSLDYAATSALGRVMAAAPEEHVKVSAAIDHWRLQSTASFPGGCARNRVSGATMAAGRGGGPPAPALLRRRKGVLRDRIRAREPAGLGHGAARGRVHALFDDGGDT